MAILVFCASLAPDNLLAEGISDAQQAQIQSAYEESRQALREDRIAEALASAERAYELAKTAFGPADPTTIKLQQNYGTFLVLVGSRTDAF
ncbi:MAG: hypothetical protein HKN70_02845, partial [Gammaproteobacteria bacterium]|nr:hypothetical protein [Gammaproteobacteria bacterium]